MEPVALFMSLVLGAFFLANLILLILLILALINLFKEKPRNLLWLEIIGFILFLPSWYILFKAEDLVGIGASNLIVFSVIAVYFLLFFLNKNRRSTFLGLLALIVLYLEGLSTFGTKSNLVSFLDTSFISTANKLVFLGEVSWLYYTMWFVVGFFVLMAIYFLIAKSKNTVLFVICLLIGLSAMIAGITGDSIVYNRNFAQKSAQQPIEKELHTVIFFRDNNVFISDTNGKPAEVLATLPAGKNIGLAKISPDEKYFAYTVTEGDKAASELNLMDLQTKSVQKLFSTSNADRVTGIIGFSADNLLAYNIYPDYANLSNQQGVPTNPDPSTLENIRVVNTGGDEVNKIIDFSRGAWLVNDLVLIKRHQETNIPGPFSMSPITDIYLSTSGKAAPEKIGQVDISTVEAGTQIFAKQPDELVIKYSSKNNQGNLGFAPMDYSAFNIKTKSLSLISLPERANPGTQYSSDMKYYTSASITPKSFFLKSVDKSIAVDATETFPMNYYWVGHQLLASTGKGLVVINLDGSVVPVSDNPFDRLLYFN